MFASKRVRFAPLYSTCLSHLQLHKYSISVVNKHSDGIVSYSIGNMNNKDYK